MVVVLKSDVDVEISVVTEVDVAATTLVSVTSTTLAVQGVSIKQRVCSGQCSYPTSHSLPLWAEGREKVGRPCVTPAAIT